ncbi:uncharacterized protein LOC114851305 [Betta splendens]|uniref:Uncharacterized protein LOC114851305 n=1 Tax=Betta splendens TaxID=158456 RepID=A0A6P7LVR5_BETSP|nr:uncharacterized protein LOC114851305 [Betta splendens]
MLKMLKLVLLLLTALGLQAVPIAAPRGLQKTALNNQIPDISETNRRGDLIHSHFGNGFGEMDRRHLLTNEVPDDIPVLKIGGSWMRVEELSSSQLADGIRQGVDPSLKIQDGFRQGTEPSMKIPDGFRQGTEPFMKIPDGFRQGTEPFMKIPDGFRQGTEPFMKIPDGFRQGTEPFMKIPEGFRQGTEPIAKIPKGFRQGTEPSVPCKGVIISGNCYEFIPTPLAFQDAQVLCRKRAPNAELASVPSGELHSHLVSLVTNGGKDTPVLTWLGGTVKDQKGSWADGSEWTYSDWMPGHPNIQSDKPVCVEMFKIDERWWTAGDCELKRASICSYSVSESQ